eukprot:4367663-Pleurochrysis_carterae.AAC.1
MWHLFLGHSDGGHLGHVDVLAASPRAQRRHRLVRLPEPGLHFAGVDAGQEEVRDSDGPVGPGRVYPVLRWRGAG